MGDDPFDMLRADEHLGQLVETHGELTLDPADDLFERLIVSILRQQVSMASAAATRERLFETVTVTPEAIQAVDDSILRDCGLSRQKTRYVNEVADAFLAEGYSIEYFEVMSDEAVKTELTSITGVGDWTAEMQLMFSLGHEDVFPVGDLGIRKGFRAVVEDVDDRETMAEYATRWAPYRSYASLYLWRATEDIAEGVDEVVER